MKRKRFTLALALALPLCMLLSGIQARQDKAQQLQKPDFKNAPAYKVVRVVDGDTITRWLFRRTGTKREP